MHGVSFGLRLSQLAAERPADVAVIFAASDGSEQVLTYGELDRRANQVARALAARSPGGVGTVAVGLGNNPLHMFTTFGAWKLGASVLPLRYDLPMWEVTRLVRVAQPTAVVADWPELDGALPSEWVAGTVSEDDGALPDRTPACASMIATSGSTGSPKIVVVANPGVYDPGANDEAMVPPAGSVFLTACPLYHANGFRFCYPPVMSANKVVLLERFDARRALRLIARHRVTHTTMVPTMLQRILRVEDVRDYELSSIQRLIYGAAPIPEWVVRGWLELIPPEAFTLVYGSSENVGIVATDGRAWLRHPGTAGVPVNCDLKITDSAYRELKPYEVGAIYVRPHRAGPPFAYLGAQMPQPASDGFWTLGDLGHVDEDGYLFVADRRQDMIISGGANVYPAEVEAALSEHPDVADSVVIGLPDSEWGQRVHAVVQPADGAELDAEILRRHCKARLASYKVPKDFELVKSLPRTSAGKLNRSALIAERTGTDRTQAKE
jgi:bile acid-coenzyme A ligase